MRVADLVTCGLQFCIITFLELSAKLFLVVTVLDTQVDDLAGDFGGSKIEGWSAVELNVLSWVVLVHVSLDTE